MSGLLNIPPEFMDPTTGVHWTEIVTDLSTAEPSSRITRKV
jgi:hypothetical protein